MSDVKSDEVIVTPEVVPEAVLDEKKEKEVVEADADVAVVAEADGTEPEEVDNKEETNGTSTDDKKEVEHKNGEATPKENGDTNGTNKDADDLELKRKSAVEEDAPEPVAEGVSPEKKLKLVAESETTEKDESVEANGEATEVSS